MPVYLYRWPGGDLSIVAASSKQMAAAYLDEWGPAEPKDVQEIKHFMLDLVLNDDGKLILGDNEGTDRISRGFSAFCAEQIAALYPAIDAVEAEPSETRDERMRQAVAEERERVKRKSKPAATPEGRGLQQQMGMSAGVADAMVRRHRQRRSE